MTYTAFSGPASQTALSSTHPSSPPNITKEYKRLRKLGWLTGTKDFDAPYDFYMSHYLLGPHLLSHLKPYALPTAAWLAIEANANISFQSDVLGVTIDPFPSFPGFEKITLDFDAEQYFAFFNVSVPPFDFTDTTVHGDNLYHDELCHGAASFLRHAKTLTLRFGAAYKAAHPWWNLSDAVWCVDHAEWEYGEARFRPHVCESGTVVDWILAYAWHQGFLQHIPHIKIEGDVQEWVKRKWQSIFKMQAQHNHNQRTRYLATADDDDDDGNDDDDDDAIDPFAIFTPDILAMETRGMVAGERASWRAEEFYPPVCTCEIGCWRLVDGRVEDERLEMSWDDVEMGEDGVVGDWNDGVEDVVGGMVSKK